MSNNATPEQRKQRGERFAALKAHLDADGPDATVPGAAKQHEQPARFAVLTAREKWGHFLNYVVRHYQLEEVAAANVHEGWQPVCYYDLDALEGDEPILMDGDVVEYEGKRRVVAHHDYEASEGEPYPVVYLEPQLGGMEPDARLLLSPEGPLDPANEDITLVERAQPDTRLPVRYDVAEMRVIVVFNTIANPALGTVGR